MRIGQGRDIHRLAEGLKLIIGGVEIPSERGCIAHSDGDVLIHAVIDALFGAAALGDIGSHYPDTDPDYSDADSMVLLQQAVRLLKEAGYRIINLDSTLILEKPKLRLYIDSVRNSLSEALCMDINEISVKAKTNEGLDSIGRGEAIEAQAVVLIENTDN